MLQQDQAAFTLNLSCGPLRVRRWSERPGHLAACVAASWLSESPKAKSSAELNDAFPVSFYLSVYEQVQDLSFALLGKH